MGPVLKIAKKLPPIWKSRCFSMHFTFKYPKTDNLGVAIAQKILDSPMAPLSARAMIKGDNYSDYIHAIFLLRWPCRKLCAIGQITRAIRILLISLLMPCVSLLLKCFNDIAGRSISAIVCNCPESFCDNCLLFTEKYLMIKESPPINNRTTQFFKWQTRATHQLPLFGRGP